MRIERDRNTIEEWVRQKQANEQQMLGELNQLFQTRQPLEKMRKVVRAALWQMWCEMANTPRSVAEQSLAKEAGLAVWMTLDFPSPNPERRLLGMIRRLDRGLGDANDLSELIRVIGDWLERGGAGLGTADINKAFRVGVDRIPRSAEHGVGRAVGQQDAIDARVWSRAVRERENPNQPGHQIEPHVAAWWVRPKFAKQSGMNMFRVRGNDLCLRMDNLFGLLRGATISGTTTDTALVLEAYGAELGLHAGYYLFPVATIAASLHHTLLEAGLALTLAGAIDSYRVGFYTSLIPKGGLPAELARAEEILRGAEEDPRNRHMVLWYDPRAGTRPDGAILWNRRFELESSKRLVEARGLLTHVRTLPEYPTQADVARFIQLMAPRLLAYLPQEFQPQRLRMSA